MARIIIGGLVDCPIFAHVDFVAHHMAETFPDFHVKKFMFKEPEYKIWLAEMNEKYDWHHNTSPIVWKENSMHGGKAKLLGGASDFWEYCYEYYGILSDLTRHDMHQMALDNLEKLLISEEKDKESRKKYDQRRVCISGAAHPMTKLLASNLLRLPGVAKRDGMIIFLCDTPNNQPKLEKLREDLDDIGAHAGLGACIVAASLGSGLFNCDLFIILDDCPREPEEDLENWLDRNRIAMSDIAEQLNENAPKQCRVILATPGPAPLCFNVMVLNDIAQNIDQGNIVAVTADLGLEALSTIARASNIPLRYISAPPVWGFIGINKFVDLHGTLHAAVVYRPNLKSVRRPVRDSTLPLGKYQLEIRKMGYLLKEVPDLWSRVQKQKEETVRLLGREPFFSKVKATSELLRFWYSSKYDGEVISLGIRSNGTFQLPTGMYFSQPAYLEDGHWTPCKNYPLPFDPYCDIRYLVPLASSILKEFEIGAHFNAEWLLTKKELDAKVEAQKTAISLRLSEECKEMEEILRNEYQREKDMEKKTQDYMDKLTVEIYNGERYLIAEHMVDAIIRDVFDVCLPYPPPPVKEPPPPKKLLAVTGDVEEEEEEDEEEGDDDDEDEDDDDD